MLGRRCAIACGDAPAASASGSGSCRRHDAPDQGRARAPPLDDRARAGAPSLQSGPIAVQLAAVRTADQVGPEWQRLVKRYPQLEELELQPPQTVEVAGKGTFYRVIAGPLATKAEAQALAHG